MAILFRLFGFTASLGLFLVLLAALGLRLYGLDWDQGFLFHPDERAILMKVGELSWPSDPAQLLSPQSPLNPHWFAYGSFPLYLLRGATYLLSLFRADFWEWPAQSGVGRVMAALFDMGSLYLTYRLGAALYRPRVGLLGAALMAFTVLSIQQSHFYVVDGILTFFVLLTLFSLWRVAHGGKKRDSALAGVALGLALASKVSAAPLLIPVAAALGLYYVSHRRLKQAAVALLIILALAAVTFLIVQPYALIDIRTFRDNIVEQGEMVRRLRDYPYTRQYIGTPPYLYALEQLALWGMGPSLGAAAWGGLAFMIWQTLARPHHRRGNLLILSWVVPYFLATGSFPVQFLRYFLPLVPFLCLAAAQLLLTWHQQSSPLGRVGHWLPVGVTTVVLLGTILYALAYTNIYRSPHPAVQVAQWIRSHVPPGKVILQEHWEEGLPLLADYRHQTMNLYEPDGPQKEQHIIQRLREGDYLALFSNRLYGTIPRLPERYPLTTRYYRLLFSGELGYQVVAFAAAYPSLMGVTLVDDTFSRPGLTEPPPLANYRPSPLTLKLPYADESFTVYDHPKVILFQKVTDLKADELHRLLLPSLSAASQKEGLLLTPAEAQAQQAGGTWRDLFDRNGLTNRFPVLSWALAVEVFSLAALPLTLFLFRSLADGGYLFAKAVGLLLVAYLTWLAASLKLLPFSPLSIVISVAAVALLSLSLGLWRRRQIADFLRQRWRLLLIGEAIFWVAFLLFLAIRLWNPDLWHPYRGGEKPMDFAYLNAVVKSTYMPPYDPWFAGGYLNYYYFGQFIVATLIKVTGIVPAVAYNLAVPLFFALTFGGAFSVIYNLAAGRPKARLLTGPLAAGLAGGVLVALLGNLDGLAQLAQGVWQVLNGHPLPPFDYWRSSRMMPPTISITEFPFFTFLFADLHAHLMGIPFTLLAMAGAVALVQRKGGWGILVFLSLVLGALRWINSWDFPTYFLLVAAALLIALWRAGERPRRLLGRWLLGVGLMYLLSTLFFWPFPARYQLFYAGLVPSPETTPPHQYLAIFGLFLFVLLTFLAVEFRRHVLAPKVTKGLLLLPGALAPAVALAVTGHPLAALLLIVLAAILLVTARKLTQPHDSGDIMALVLFALAIVVTLAVELVTLEGDIQRMNTVFKFYLQGWLLMGVAAAYGLWRLWGISKGSVIGWGWRSAAIVLLLASLTYPVMATPVRAGDRFQPLPPTLDGSLFMEKATYRDEKGDMALVWDYQAIQWLQDNVPGSPIIAEGVTPNYRWGGRVSVYTGLPTVAGWEWHQMQQRWGYRWMVEERLADVRQLFTTPDVPSAVNLLSKYGIDYIYVGQVERLYYPPAGIDKFPAMVGRYLKVAYQNPGAVIYQVLDRETSGGQ